MIEFTYINKAIDMYKWFNRTPRLIQVLLLLLPGVNWVIEILVRWSVVIHDGSFFKILFAVIVTVFGLVFGWIDLIWCLLFKHMIFAV